MWRVRLLAIFAVVVVLTGVGAARPAGTVEVAGNMQITVTPSTGLVDGQSVVVEGSGFPKSSLREIFECAGDAVDDTRCDGYNADWIDTDPAGDVYYGDFRVDARIYLPDGTEYDCRTEPAGCKIGVGFMIDHHLSAFAPLSFDPSAPLRPPVTGTVVPSTGLVDQQTVTVTGEHASNREAGWVLQCITGTEPLMCDYGAGVSTPVEPDETFTIEYTVDQVLHAMNGPLTQTVDCATAPGTCSIDLSTGYAFGVPDRHATVPIAFATEPTTSPTTEPTTSPTTAPTTEPSTSPSTSPSGSTQPSTSPSTDVVVSTAGAVTTSAGTLPATGAPPRWPALFGGFALLTGLAAAGLAAMRRAAAR